jgi:hypothetical protein
MTINNIADIRAALLECTKYIKSLKKEEMTSDMKAADVYKLVHATDYLVDAPHILPQERAEEEE